MYWPRTCMDILIICKTFCCCNFRLPFYFGFNFCLSLLKLPLGGLGCPVWQCVRSSCNWYMDVIICKTFCCWNLKLLFYFGFKFCLSLLKLPLGGLGCLGWQCVRSFCNWYMSQLLFRSTTASWVSPTGTGTWEAAFTMSVYLPTRFLYLSNRLF